MGFRQLWAAWLAQILPARLHAAHMLTPLPMLPSHHIGRFDVDPCQVPSAALHLPAGICSRGWAWTRIQPSPWWSASRGWSPKRGSISSGTPSTAQPSREGNLCCLGQATQMEPSGGQAAASGRAEPGHTISRQQGQLVLRVTELSLAAPSHSKLVRTACAAGLTECTTGGWGGSQTSLC